MKKALISRYCAYGDAIHCSHLPHLLKLKGYDVVDVEANIKLANILYENPFIDNLTVFERNQNHLIYSNPFYMRKRWDIISKGYDKFINLYGSLEQGCIAMEFDAEYFMHDSNRKEMRDINFYDQTSLWAGFPEEVGKWQGEIYFNEEEENIVKKFMTQFEGKFVVMINLSGTTIHKRFIIAKEIANWLLNEYRDVHIITTGDSLCKPYDIQHERSTSIVGKFPFRQALNIAKYVNLFLSMESGLAVGANAFGTPTIQLMTSSSLNNHPKYAANDYSLQSPAYCSPCSKGPYRFIGCPHKNGFPLCVYFNPEDVKAQIRKVYENSFSSNTKN